MVYKAFVSSTFEDLKDHRAHVIRSLRRAGFVVDPMEDWPADRDEPKQFSQDRLHGCNLCVMLVAFRRGYVPEGETRSITQLEYAAAVKQGIDILPFLLDENAAWSRKFDELDKDPGVRTWREQLKKSHGVESFDSEPRSIDLTGVLGRWLTQNKSVQAEPRNHERIAWPDDKSPYPGLLWFNEEYAPLFFGRDHEVDELVGKMSEPGGRVLIVSGASGSGKSSLVAAGLWQAVMKKGRLPGSTQWVWHRIQPSDGTALFDVLAVGLKQVFHLSVLPDLTAPNTTLRDLLSKNLSKGQELILFVDQLEELFTRGFKPQDIQAFLEQLIGETQDKANRLRVVATIRSEFLGNLEAFETTLQILNGGYNYHLGPVSPRIMQDMIEKPAQRTGYEFEQGLVARMLAEAGQEPGNLPLVGYALKEMFERQVGRMFTLEAYNAIGGVAGAIGTKADQVVGELPDEVRSTFDTVFVELVHLERERPPTRKRVSFARFTPDKAASQLIEALAGPDCRVLVKSGNQRDTVVEVAHEKLFTAWKKLKDWIDDSGTDLRLIDYAEEAATRWHDLGRHLRELWWHERAQSIQQALIRFNKTASPQLETLLRPQQILIERLKSETLSHQDRLLVGQKLAEFGDPRPGVGLRQDGLPDIVWIDIPGGRIKLEGVDHVFEVRPFRMAKYLVTNAQFEAFIKAEDGYRNEKWWKGIERSEGASLASWQEANAPRETVSWFEAVAFCRWLSHRIGSTIRLPTEWEWQQAATGGDPMIEYPWPGGWNAARCNSWESRLGQTTAVGLYLDGTSRQGLLDMAGNVWEWCLSTEEQSETLKSVGIHASAGSQRVLRGGCWFNKPGNLRVSFRFRRSAVSRYDYIGFRLAQNIL